jgi:hypothetical protein
MCIRMAWQHISADVILKGFRKCCIISAVDGTDDILWNGSEEGGNVRNECEEDEGYAINSKIFLLADVLFLKGCLRCG